MKAGDVLNLVGAWKHHGGGVIMTFKLGKKCATKALLLELEGDPDKSVDVEAALKKLGYVKAKR